MELYSHGASWLPGDSFHEQTRFNLLKSPDALPPSNLTVAFLVALGALLSRIIGNRKVPRCLARKVDVLVALKALFSVAYVAAAAAILADGQKGQGERMLPSAGAAAAIAFLGASISEHYRSIAPSTLTTLYAIFGTAFYAYTARSLYEVQALPVQLYANSAAAVSLFALIGLECKSKRNLLLPTDPPPAYESTLSFLVRPFFPHIFPLLYIGSKRRIKLPELRDIPLYLRADPATEKLLAALATGDKTSTRYLIRSTFRAFGAQFLGPVLPRLIMLAGTFSQVTLVEQTILYVSDKSIPMERGTVLISAYFVVYVSLAISNYVYSEKVNAFMVLYGSALTGSLYAKTLRLTSMAAREVGQGAATTYMSVDVEMVTSGFQTFQELWAAVVTIIIACIMLWYKAGYVMLAPLLFIITLISSTSTVGRFIGPAQEAWLAAIDVRIKLLTSVLGQLLPIKLGAYEAALARKINALRTRETQALRRFLTLISVAATLSDIGPSAAFLVTLAAYVVMRAHNWGALAPLDVSRIFTLFTIVNILGRPLSSIGEQLPGLFASFASLGRIQGFLQLPERAASDSDQDSVDALVDVSDDGAKVSTVQVSLKGCTFGWDDKTQVLRDITLELVPRELHMVVGSVASGKSSLLMSILGETRLVEGVLAVKARKIALASQTPFIYPGTLRANILLDSAFDAAFYERVIDACGLRQDIEALPQRDRVKLGDKGASTIHALLGVLTCCVLGATLSGGQRQRLAIARAVYARTDLVLLDDVFSALDGETEAHVFASLFGPDGMLKGKTTVLVTHGVHHLPSADKVIVMDAGRITHFGSFEDVRDAGVQFALASTAVDADAAGKSQGTAKQNATEATVVDEEKEEEEAWSAEQASRRGAYAFYAKCTGVPQTSTLLALITAWSSVGLFATAYLSMLASSSGDHLGLWVAGYGGIVMLNLSFMAMTLFVWGYALAGFTAPNIHTVELAGVLASPISWITKNPVGRILNRFSQDIQIADQEFPFAFINFAIDALGTIGTFVFITLAMPLLAFAVPILAVVGFYSLRFYLVTSKVDLPVSRISDISRDFQQFRRLELGSKSPLYTLFGTTVSGLITVRAYRAQGYFRAQNSLFVNESQGALHHQLAGQLFLRVFLLWFQTILACSVAVLTVWLRDTTSAAFLGVALSRLVGLGMLLSHLLTSFASVENGSIAIDRIQEYATLPAEEKTGTADEIAASDLSSWPSAGNLVFSDFSMRYRDDLPPTLKNLSFALEGGLKIGICGRTGSGKSSTVLSLFRGIDQHLVTGKIVIDGVDISTVPLKTLRESMSIVTQDPFLWHGSIRENLDIINERTEPRFGKRLNSLRCTTQFPLCGLRTYVVQDDKLDHLVVDEESFSKGQRQLLCLARALLRNKKIIVLDESTSRRHGPHHGQKIRHVVDSQMKGFTVIAIAHRISTIVNYDKILVLDRAPSPSSTTLRCYFLNPSRGLLGLLLLKVSTIPTLFPRAPRSRAQRWNGHGGYRGSRRYLDHPSVENSIQRSPQSRNILAAPRRGPTPGIVDLLLGL
ncbi:P-loop containing nucleoside triphosphate hydrolase protein [Mycena rosella]|uniref:P-loop containing nucleoside triphosphate hydrolase protein n=1 Tax=Mycena rosella TaxID=1033263 RepID=A0AAD7CMA6_MYCRO|nr:P-loop containing nucleoside triphosphate hydrolase protein [Mycena rosella]